MSSKTKVIIDTDADFDDYMAMVYLLSHPEIEVVAIAVTGCGAVHLSKGVRHVADMLTLFKKPVWNTPVLQGAKAPLRYSNVFSAKVREGADAHYGAAFPATNPAPQFFDAQAWLVDYFLNTQDQVTVLSIGGGTNFGTLFARAQLDPVLKSAVERGIEQIVMMGGNLLPEYVTPGAGGNIMAALGDNPIYHNEAAEWNIFIDPLGAQYLFEFGVPVRLVALNATNDVPLSQDFVDALNKINTPHAQFISQVLTYKEVAQGIGTYLSFWDPLAACTVVDPGLVTTQDFKIRVEQELDEEKDSSAKLIVDAERGQTLAVALSANAQGVYAEYLKTMALDVA